MVTGQTCMTTDTNPGAVISVTLDLNLSFALFYFSETFIQSNLQLRLKVFLKVSTMAPCWRRELNSQPLNHWANTSHFPCAALWWFFFPFWSFLYMMRWFYCSTDRVCWEFWRTSLTLLSNLKSFIVMKSLRCLWDQSCPWSIPLCKPHSCCEIQAWMYTCYFSIDSNCSRYWICCALFNIAPGAYFPSWIALWPQKSP